MKTAILLVGHGSRAAEADEAVHAAAAMVRDRSGCSIVEVAFFEKRPPDVQSGIDRCVARGAERILLAPFFLLAGVHVLKDLPAEIEKATTRHPGLRMVLAEPLGGHPKLAEIVWERIEAALATAGW